MLVDDACGSCLKHPQAAISGVNMKVKTLVISMVTKYRSCFGSRMSQVQILPPRPSNTYNYNKIDNYGRLFSVGLLAYPFSPLPSLSILKDVMNIF